MKSKKTRFTAKDDQFIINNHLSMSPYEIAVHLQFSRTGVMNRMNILRVKTPESIKSERIKKNQFENGHPPIFKKDVPITPIEDFKQGDKAILIPGKHSFTGGGTSQFRCRVMEILRAMTEEVTILKLDDGTGNTKVKDKSNIIFYCNTRDLRPFSEDYF